MYYDNRNSLGNTPLDFKKSMARDMMIKAMVDQELLRRGLVNSAKHQNITQKFSKKIDGIYKEK